jgi:hypothetical protein
MYSKGISWIDDCRIPYVDTNEYQKRDAYKEQTIYGNGKGMPLVYWETNTQGRFPANILVSDDMLNDGVISKSNDHKWEGEDTSPIYGKYENRTRTQVYSDKGSNSRYYNIDKWFEKLLND